ncbi:hypothetical protein GCM10028810_43770 [Spirosoma litoris]
MVNDSFGETSHEYLVVKVEILVRKGTERTNKLWVRSAIAFTPRRSNKNYEIELIAKFL